MSTYYEYWYRRSGVRKAAQLITPPLSLLATLELPRQSILHSVVNSPIEYGPSANEYLFRNIQKPIMMEHVVDLGDNLGSPRKLSISADSLIRTYHLKYRRYRHSRSLETSIKDPNTLLVVNYGIIPHIYKYMRSMYTEFYKWKNANAAVWKKVEQLANDTDRQQFILCKLPVVLPSIPDLNLGSGTLSQKVIKIFNNPDSLMLLEIWKWLGENRKDSSLSNISDKNLSRVNLIYQETGKWFVINLGMLNSWRKATKDELIINPDAPTTGYDSKQMQRRFLRMALTLFQVRSVAAVEIPPELTTPELTGTDAPAGDGKSTDKVVQKDDALLNKPTEKSVNNTQVQTQAPNQDNTITFDVPQDNDDPDTLPEDDVDVDAQLEQELAHLEAISKNHVERNFDEEADETQDADSYNQELFVEEPATLEDGVINVCDKLADMGLLSAAEYRRYMELSKKYKTIISPNGVDTLDKFIQVDKKLLKVDNVEMNIDNVTIVDKSMLKSSLVNFDKKYIREVMQKDIASMVMSIQNCGIAVTDYEVETNEDVLGAFNSYTVRITPVEGTSSSLRFKLPVLSDDGTYMGGSVKYKLRRQRGDLPIRKIAPDRIALTSYYGKVFVGRSTKHVNDYGQWVRNSIMARGLDPENQTINNLQPADVFDNLYKTSRFYSVLAKAFRGFSVRYGDSDFNLLFDHTKRELQFGKEAIDAYEKDGAIIIGTNTTIHNKGMGPLGTTIYLVMDTNNTLYSGVSGNLNVLCPIEEFLGLDSFKAPVDLAELLVMGKNIPIGIILGYKSGLTNLIKMLGCSVRRINAGSRVNLEANEYSIVFSDETLVFSKEDRKASIILAGFNEYHKAIRNYSVYEFDKPGVYLNTIESAGCGVRYLREIDRMYKMFIDPITKDLLIEMKEPTTFHGLLLRSCEMLLDDSHPDELDPAYMRIKGYERMAGAVYTEIIKSIRAHDGRSGRSKLPIEMNPYAVWRSISDDPSVAIVSDINPIENLKEVEAVTYSGAGGRNSRSMTKRTRAYHKNDMGTMSESTVDSSDVAINTFTSADPQFTSLRGISKPYSEKETGTASLLSTSALLAPCSDMDDPKRVNY